MYLHLEVYLILKIWCTYFYFNIRCFADSKRLGNLSILLLKNNSTERLGNILLLNNNNNNNNNNNKADLFSMNYFFKFPNELTAESVTLRHFNKFVFFNS